MNGEIFITHRTIFSASDRQNLRNLFATVLPVSVLLRQICPRLHEGFGPSQDTCDHWKRNAVVPCHRCLPYHGPTAIAEPEPCQYPSRETQSKAGYGRLHIRRKDVTRGTKLRDIGPFLKRSSLFRCRVLYVFYNVDPARVASNIEAAQFRLNYLSCSNLFSRSSRKDSKDILKTSNFSGVMLTRLHSTIFLCSAVDSRHF